MSSNFGTYKKAVLNLLYPRRCPVCDGIVGGQEEKICPGCLGKLKLLLPPWCMKCGKRTDPGREFCSDCQKKTHQYDRGRVLYEYESIAMAIYRFKYGGRREYADFFGEQIQLYLGDFIRSVKPDMLVPIPLHRRRQRVRGYNQAELLATSVGQRFQIPVRKDLLIRNRDTVPQKKLNPEERQNNLKKAFIISENDVKSRVIILIDDIYTTGATMDEAARVLREAGAGRIYYIALTCGTGV